MKTNTYRTKKKQQREASANEADELINDFLDQNYLYNNKTREILAEYLENKEKDERLSD